MFFCLFGDLEVLEYSVDFLDQHTITLQDELKKYVQDHGIVPHPVVLLKDHFPLVLKQPASSRTTMSKRPAMAMSSGMSMMSD